MNGSPSGLVRADLGNDRVVAVEVVNIDPEAPVGIRDLLSFEGVTQSIEAIADSVTAGLERVQPDRAAVEFGVDVGVEAGGLTALLVKGTGTATLKVTLEWEKSTGPRGHG